MVNDEDQDGGDDDGGDDGGGDDDGGDDDADDGGNHGDCVGSANSDGGDDVLPALRSTWLYRSYYQWHVQNSISHWNIEFPKVRGAHHPLFSS